MWKELVLTRFPDGRLAPGAGEAELSKAESRLGLAIPTDLRSLLGETNGVAGKYGEGLIWSVERIATDNLEFRSNPDFPDLYMPFDPLLFFADDGGGDQFAFRVLDGDIPLGVFRWDHENDSRTWVAPDLHRYLEWLAEGRFET
jgi:hypothetical protein